MPRSEDPDEASTGTTAFGIQVDLDESDSDESTDSTNETTVFLSNPMLDYWAISAVTAIYSITVLSIVTYSWQALIQDDALVGPLFIGALVIFGTFLSIRYW